MEEKDGDKILDIRQSLCWKYYADPKSETFGNAMASARRAGYAESSCNIVTTFGWFKQKLLKLNLLSKAEKVLNKTLDMDTIGDNGKEQADLLRVQNDAAKFIAKTLGKDDGYSERTEVTGKDGEAIVFMPAELMDKYGLNTETKTEDTK